MQTRRDFIRTAAMLSGAAGVLGGLTDSVRRALAIEPEKGSSVLDAEHVVILMQENRSFDHAFGALRGVRGFNDPRAIRLADGNPVWVQANAAGDRYVPFRFDIKETKTTWMGSLPHGWADQVDAANGGKHDRWLDVKKSGHLAYARMPLTLGYYTRDDIPFYYALADAFTICDQYFCSSLTGTTPNRLYLWTGTIREKPAPDSPASVRNENCDYGKWANWKTFPERLEDHGVSWKIYQNELTVPNGLTGEADAWLANFGDNPIEWFLQFHVRFADNHRKFL
jgi:phospholipase C